MNINLKNVVGCICEMKTMDNEFIALGKINAYHYDDKSLEIVSSDGSEMLSLRYATKIRINVFNSEHGFLGLQGFVYIAHSSFWRLYDISCVGDNERRSYFRIKIRSQAEIEEIIEQEEAVENDPNAVDKQVTKYPCVVTSVSVSGVLIAPDNACNFHIGSKLMVSNFTVGESELMFSLRCSVKRTEYHDKLGKLYGCEFIELNDKEIEKLCQEIFAQQRLEIQRRRGTP